MKQKKMQRDIFKAASKGKMYTNKKHDFAVDTSNFSKADRKAVKSDYKKYKYETKLAKQQLKKDYKHLKQDYKADKGKQLYNEGYRIRSNAGTKILSTSATVAGAAYTAFMMDMIGDKAATNIIAGAGAAAVVGAGVSVYNRHKDRNLRAYYNHTSNY